MDVIERIINKLPFPVIVTLGIIIISGWIIKEYYGWQNYGDVFRYNLFIAILVLCISVLASYYAVVFMFKFIESKKSPLSLNGFVIAVSDFVGEPKLGSSIADEIEEALLNKIREDKLNIRVLEGVIKTPINGPNEAKDLASQYSVDLIAWGKLIDYGNNFKLIPKIYITNPIEELKLRGRNLDTIIINPSDISLREANAIDLAQFTALILGVLNFNQGKYDKAIEIFTIITNKYEAEAKFYLGLCYYLISPSLWDRAIDHIKKAIELYPDFGIAYVNLGMIQLDVRFFHQAYDSFIIAEEISKSAKDIELLSAVNSGLGLYYLNEGNYEKAESNFQSSIQGYTKLNVEESVANQYGNLALAKLRLHELKL